MCETCRLEYRIHRRHASRRAVLQFAAASAFGLALGGAALAEESKTPPKPQNVLSPGASLALLQKGNQRYVEGISRRHDFKHEREVLVGGQNPYASILSCADSRIARPNMPSIAAAVTSSFAGWREISPMTIP
jgi:carbonic anhydrase